MASPHARDPEAPGALEESASPVTADATATPGALDAAPPSTSQAAPTRRSRAASQMGSSRTLGAGDGPPGSAAVPHPLRLERLEVAEDEAAQATRATLLASSAAPPDDDMVRGDEDDRRSMHSHAAPTETSAAASAAASRLRAATLGRSDGAPPSGSFAASAGANTSGPYGTGSAAALTPKGPAGVGTSSGASPAPVDPRSGSLSRSESQQHPDGAGAAAGDDDGSDRDTAAELQAAANRKWRSRRKHVFILSSAGRPIFTRWGNEYDFAELFGLLQTLVSLVGTSQETLRRVSMGTHQMHFRASRELTLVMVTATGESSRACADQLRMLELQLLAVLPNANDILERHPNFDVRRMFAAGDLRVMQQLIRRMNNDLGFVLSATPVLPLPVPQRAAIHRVLLEHYQGGGDYDDDQEGGSNEDGADGADDSGEHLYAMVLAAGKVAAFARPEAYPLPTADMLLLINFAYSVLTTRGEVWAPICLPGVNDTGYLWCYVHVLRPEVLLVHVATSQAKFPDLSVAASHIADRLAVAGLLDALENAARAPWPELPPALTRLGLQHLVAVRNEQVLASLLPAHICTRGDRKAYLRKLVQLRDEAASVSTAATPFLVHSTAVETVLVELSGTLDTTTLQFPSQTFAVFAPTTPRSDLQHALTAVLRYVQAVEAQQLMPRPVLWEDFDG